MEQPPVISGEQLARLMGPDDYVAAVEAAFRAHAEGRTSQPMPLHIEVDGGGFHAKGAFVALDRPYVAVKVNSNFPGNPGRGLPTIQGAVLLYDAVDGRLLAILDSLEITSKRTAAASALAARHLARLDARTIEVKAVATLGEATLAADIIVTATSSHAPFLTRDCVRPGTFIAAIGADNPHKSELHPDLFVGTKVVVDSLEQASVMGDLHHAIDAGKATRDSVHAELADLVAGRKPGRTGDAEITIFDSTGLAIQDVASAAVAYARFIGGSSPCLLQRVSGMVPPE